MELNEILASAKDLEALVIGKGVLPESAEYIKRLWPGHKALIVADTNTWNAAGRRIAGILQQSGIETAEPLIFTVPPYLHADYEHVIEITRAASEIDSPLLVAVGSGTINDLVKRSAHELKTTYICIGTAASMDGYCSSGAALSKNGRKQTMECGAPRVVIADTEVLKTAPSAASAAGYGDLASKLTAGADWIIADFTGDDKIDERVWGIVQPKLEGWLESPEVFAAGDGNKLSGVFEGLNLCGLAMQILGRSRAASGAEHMFSHIWEMSGHLGADGLPVSHGFQVSLGIMCVTALYQELFSMEADEIDIDAAVEAYPDWEKRSIEVKDNMGMLPSWEEYLDICREKHLSKEKLHEKLVTVKEGWNELRARVVKRLPPYEEMKKMLSSAGCPVKPEDINLAHSDAISAYYKAQSMRTRYTVLDLAYELGVFSKYVERIENSRIYLR